MKWEDKESYGLEFLSVIHLEMGVKQSLNFSKSKTIVFLSPESRQRPVMMLRFISEFRFATDLCQKNTKCLNLFVLLLTISLFRPK